MIDPNAGFFGLYRGNVYSNKDPLKQGRLRLRVPQILADQITDWAWGITDSSVDFEIPSVGQGIWVAFEGGNPSYPIWVGTFGTDKTGNVPLYVDHLKSDEDVSDVTDLLDIQELSDGTKELVLTQTLLNIVRNRYYGSFYDLSTHSAALANTAYAMRLDHTDEANGVSVVDETKITMQHAGVYNIAFSAQIAASNNSEHEINIWLRHQGVDVPGTASKLVFKGHTIAAWNFFVKTTSLPQYWELMWSTGSGGDVVSVATIPAAAPVPLIPALILTVNKVR